MIHTADARGHHRLVSRSLYAQQIRDVIARSSRVGTMEWREGFVPNEVVAVWLRACDSWSCRIETSTRASGVSVPALGVPIVATKVGSLAEYIDGTPHHHPNE